MLELAISLGLIGVIVETISFAYYISLRSWGYELNRIEAKTEPHLAIDQFWKDLDEATTVTLAQASCIRAGTPSGNIGFRWDSATGRLHRIQGGSTTACTGAGITATTIANRIGSVDLNYVNASGVVLSRPVSAAQLGAIRTIQLDIQGQMTYLFATETVTSRNQLSPRNLP